MNVKQLKAVTAILLLLANLFFVLLIAVNYRNKNYYDSKTIENAYKAIESGGMKVSRGILERKQPTFYVYTGARGISACDDILILYGSISEHYNIGDDVSVISEEGIFTFYRDGSFIYKTFDGVQSTLDGSLLDVTAKGKIKKDIKEVICEFLKTDELEECESNRKSGVKVDISLESVYYEPTAKIYAVTAYQTFDGERISSEGIEFIIDGEEVVRAEGTFSFVYPTEKLPADCIDTLNVMLSEKAYFGEHVPERLTITEITYFYSVYDSADGKRYFIPMCCVFYNKTDVWGIYNLISGKRE